MVEKQKHSELDTHRNEILKQLQDLKVLTSYYDTVNLVPVFKDTLVKQTETTDWKDQIQPHGRILEELQKRKNNLLN